MTKGYYLSPPQIQIVSKNILFQEKLKSNNDDDGDKKFFKKRDIS